MTERYDVVVVGGGPSGLNVSRRLAEKGLKVLVLEKKERVGDRVICTGIIGKEVFQEFGLSREAVLREIKDVKMVSPYKSFLCYQHPSAFACVVDREKFDLTLAEGALANGAELKLGYSVTDIFREKDGVNVIVNSESMGTERIRAKVAVIATGVDFTLSRKLGLGIPGDYLFGVQAEIDAEETGQATIFVGKEITTGGFAWAVPTVGRKVRIGLITEQDPSGCFEVFLNKFYPGVSDLMPKKNVRLKPIAQGLASRTYGDRVIAVGEAAGQIKTTTGGGIYFGLLCSEIAARTILKTFKRGTFTANALSDYEKSWKEAIHREIVIGYWTRKIGSRLSDLHVESLFRLARNDGIIPLIKEKGSFDWHGDLILRLVRRLPASLLLRARLEKTISQELNQSENLGSN